MKKALLDIERVRNLANEESRELLLLIVYKDDLSCANIANLPSVTKFELDDKPGSNQNVLQGKMSVLASDDGRTSFDHTASKQQQFSYLRT